MLSSTKALLILAPAALLAGCGGTVNRGLDPVHQPIVQRADYALDLSTTPDGLAAGEEQRLDAWLASLRFGYGDRVSVDDPSGVVRPAVARVAARYGVIVSDDVLVTRGELAEGAARVIVSRSTASVPGCPDWSRMGGSDFDANTGSNFGCASNATLAAMVARPEDLVRGQSGTGAADPATVFKSIDSYRKAPPTGAGGTAVKAETTKGGN